MGKRRSRKSKRRSRSGLALLTMSEAAREAGVTKQAIRDAVNRGALPYVTIQVPAMRIDRDALRAYIAITGGNPGRPPSEVVDGQD
jgi:excisionase family DNA binding protein